MTRSSETLDPYRARVLADVHELIDAVDLTHMKPVREHLESVEGTSTRAFDAAALHLFAVEALTGDAPRGLRVASALALLALSADVMAALRSSATQPAGVLEGAWGMPRTLNAGDAFYALAQQSLLRLDETGMASEDVMKASSVLRSAALGLCEDLLAPGEAHSRRVLAAALEASLMVAGGLDEQAGAMLTSHGRLNRETLRTLGVDEAAVRSLEAALDELAKERFA